MPETPPISFLMDCLRSRNISANYAELQQAADQGLFPDIYSWIAENLGTETLLTKDELALYLALEKSGELDLLPASSDTPAGKIFDDQEFRDAIEELKKSTLAIEKQDESLKMQQDALRAIAKSNRQSLEAREVVEATQNRSWMTESIHISSAVNELSQILKYQITELESKCRTADATLKETASELLRTDDKLLTGLQKLAGDFEPRQSEEEKAAQLLRDMCARLIKYIVEGVRTRLDRVYLETVNGEQIVRNGNSTDNRADVTSLQTELESLYTEILPVAQMSVEQQYLERALGLIAAQDVQDIDRTKEILDYTLSCISALFDRLQAFTAHVEEHQAYRYATMRLINVVKVELESNRPPISRPAPSSPTRVRKLSKPISPVRPRNTRRRSSTPSFEDDISPELQLLRNLAISLPSEQQGDRTLNVNLQAVIADRTNKLHGHAKSLREASETSIASHLHDSQVTLLLLRQSLLSESQYGRVRLLETNVGQSILKLDNDIEELRKIIGAVNIDVLKEKNTKKEELIERWAP